MLLCATKIIAAYYTYTITAWLHEVGSVTLSRKQHGVGFENRWVCMPDVGSYFDIQSSHYHHPYCRDFPKTPAKPRDPDAPEDSDSDEDVVESEDEVVLNIR